MKKNNFTLSEIIIAIVIIGILATISIPLYNNTVENAKARACEVNLKTILGAIEAHTLERNSFPGSLSAISDKNFRKAWVKVLKEEGVLKVKLTYFLVNLDENDLVYAATAAKRDPWIRRFIGDSSVLRCPVVVGGNSYGLNAGLEGKTYEEYKAESENSLIVGDSNNDRFSSAAELEPRHKEYNFLTVSNYAVVLTKNREKVKIVRSGGSSANGSKSDDKNDKDDGD